MRGHVQLVTIMCDQQTAKIIGLPALWAELIGGSANSFPHFIYNTSTFDIIPNRLHIYLQHRSLQCKKWHSITSNMIITPKVQRRRLVPFNRFHRSGLSHPFLAPRINSSRLPDGFEWTVSFAATRVVFEIQIDRTLRRRCSRRGRVLIKSVLCGLTVVRISNKWKVYICAMSCWYACHTMCCAENVNRPAS